MVSNGRSGSSKQKPKKGSSGAKVQWKGFINYRPTASDKQGLDNRIRDGFDPLSQLEDVLQHEYKLGITFSDSAQTFTATLYCQNPQHTDAGYVLSARAAEPFEAVRRLLYLHIHVFPDGWNAGMEQVSDDEW